MLVGALSNVGIRVSPTSHKKAATFLQELTMVPAHVAYALADDGEELPG